VRVLHLAPPSARPQSITGHTFIDEEIRALCAAGVECLTVSDAESKGRTCDGVDIVPVASPAPPSAILRTLAIALRHARLLPTPSRSQARGLFHALRIEATAAAVIRSRGVDLIHSHFAWPAGFGGLIAAAHTGTPLVASLRGMDLLVRPDLEYGLRQDPFFDATVRHLLAGADRTVYATEFMRAIGQSMGAPTDGTVVVRKGVDLDRFQPAVDRKAARHALGIDVPLILTIGTLRPLKGFPFLLRALSQLVDLQWRLVICGEGPDRASLERCAEELHLGDRVHFAGTIQRDRITDYFAAADIVVHPSLIEAAGNVVLEALASGCATIATDSGGPAEHIIEGETGMVVPPADEAALASRLRQLLADPALRERLGRAARRDAEQRYEYGRMVRDLLRVYEAARKPMRSATKSTNDGGMRSFADRASSGVSISAQKEPGFSTPQK